MATAKKKKSPRPKKRPKVDGPLRNPGDREAPDWNEVPRIFSTTTATYSVPFIGNATQMDLRTLGSKMVEVEGFSEEEFGAEPQED
jgi:hypothetical protein